MIPIKIQCGCGQKYAFEVEAAGGRMPHSVACPVCGMDGTEVANAFIAQSSPPVSVAHQNLTPPAPSASSMRLAGSAPETTARGAVSHIPKPDRAQAETEARAKVSWGDPPETVTSFLMIQGFSFEEANELVHVMYSERAAIIRRNGFKKMASGIGMMCVPVIAFFMFMSAGYLPLKLFAIFILIGLWGAWRVLKSMFMILAPKSEPGDVAEQ